MVAELTRTQFIVAMALEICRKNGLPAKGGLPLASDTYREFEAAEHIKFGDPRYAWDGAAARTLCAEYELT